MENTENVENLVSYVVLKDYDKTMEKLRGRVRSTYEIEKPPYFIGARNEDLDVMYVMPETEEFEESKIKMNKTALTQYLGLLEAKCTTKFVENTLNLNVDGVEKAFNDILNGYWSFRHRAQYKVNGDQKYPNKMYAVHVEDQFTRKEGEIRQIHTDSFKLVEDETITSFVGDYLDKDWEFFESVMAPLKTSSRYYNDAIEVEGREILLGLAITSSEFGTGAIKFGLYAVDTHCTNQLVSKNNVYTSKIVHRRKFDDLFKADVQEAIIDLSDKVKIFGDSIKNSTQKKLPIKDIREILNSTDGSGRAIKNAKSINRRFGFVPDRIRQKIVAAYEEEPLGLTNFGLYEACTRVLRDNREMEDNSIFISAIDSLLIPN